jgi:hypothetical protein
MRPTRVLLLPLLVVVLSSCFPHYSGSHLLDELNAHGLRVTQTYQNRSLSLGNIAFSSAAELFLAATVEDHDGKSADGSLIVLEFLGIAAAKEANEVLLGWQETLKDTTENPARPNCLSQKFLKNRKVFLDKCHDYLPLPGVQFFLKDNIIVITLQDVSDQNVQKIQQILDGWK